MKIAIVTEHRLPVLAYGGIERVVWYLVHELSKLGHQVTLIAPYGSECPFAKLASFNDVAQISQLIPQECDIVHFHGKVYPTSKPYVVTLHGNLKPFEKADVNTIFVSRNHAERHNSESYVYNGLDWDDYGDVPLDNIRLHYHFLGNAAWRVKNVKGAIDVIKLLPEERLWVMGGHRFNLKMGMRFTFNRQVSFMSEAYGEDKLRLLKESKGFIFPVTWHEPFGLAIIESLYCGAPVFGTPYGSLPEIVIPEVGFLTNNSLEMARRIDSKDRFNPRLCHEYVCDMFNSKKMAESYLTKYEIVLNYGTLDFHEPYTNLSDRGLDWINVKSAPLYIPSEEKD